MVKFEVLQTEWIFPSATERQHHALEEPQQIEADVQGKWAEKWSGFSFDGIGGFTFTNLSDLLKGLIPGFTSSSEPAAQ